MSKNSNEVVRNRKAYHDYEILETFEAGISLKGTEIKAIRSDGVTLQEAYVKVLHGEVWLIGAHVPPYKFGNIHNHEERRDRKLLLHKREINSLKTATKEKGLTIVPLSLYFSKGRLKVKIGIAKGKKSTDKRATIKERDEKRNMQRAMKNC